jgi:hypothetical protein
VAELSPDKIVVGAIGAVIGAAIGSLLRGGLTSAIGVPLTSAGSIASIEQDVRTLDMGSCTSRPSRWRTALRQTTRLM